MAWVRAVTGAGTTLPRDRPLAELPQQIGRDDTRECPPECPAPSHGPRGGVADSLDEAEAAFRAAWQRDP
jgi:hypothetical protein